MSDKAEFSTYIECADILTFYIPVGTVDKCIEDFVHHIGGCTITSGRGVWISPDHEHISESVQIVQVVVPHDRYTNADIKHVGLLFLQANKLEQAFLATRQTRDGIAQIIVRRH